MHGAKSKHDGQGFWRDAKLLEKSMAGLGTKDTQLIYLFVPLSLAYCFYRQLHCIDWFVLIGTLTVLKLSRMLIDDDMRNHLRVV